jgi:serine/threonine-protein kinase HipA
MTARRLYIYLNDQRIGTLDEAEDLWRLTYTPEWQAAPDGIDLSPALARSRLVHDDGGSNRPVQWYFDNLLPEEQQRSDLSREANIPEEDAFGLLAYLGAESAGSLILLPPDTSLGNVGDLVPLTEEALSTRIRAMPRIPLASSAPKRMSAAGAQSKLLVVEKDGLLFEPRGAAASTHMLKVDNGSADYPHTVINEYAMMRLAAAVGLDVPRVSRRYVPDSVYLVQRFDREGTDKILVERTHIIDACQLLNRARTFKYKAATIRNLHELMEACSNPAVARLHLYRWFVFNLLIGNNDNHLKNLSFRVSAEGVRLAPAYDLLSTAVYHTRACAADNADWPRVLLTLALPECATYEQLTRQAVLAAAAELAVPKRIAERELDSIARGIQERMPILIDEIQAQNVMLPEAARPAFAGELRLLNAIRHIVIAETLSRVAD